VCRISDICSMKSDSDMCTPNKANLGDLDYSSDVLTRKRCTQSARDHCLQCIEGRSTCWQEQMVAACKVLEVAVSETHSAAVAHTSNDVVAAQNTVQVGH